MKQTLKLLCLTVLFLALIDSAVALTLTWADRSGRLGSLIRYFDYGRSVPGKLAEWQAHPGVPGNLFEVAWRQKAVMLSHERFLAEPRDAGPVIRSYGMSFVNHILEDAVGLRPDLVWDSHAGPGAPPNYTYAMFQDDRANRRAGDIVVLGILSSSLPAMAAFSNRTWVFEQPAPFTYPVYQPEGDGLARIEPLVESAAQERALATDPATRQAWIAQLSRHDAFYGFQTFGAPALDASPFMRLVRRSLATSHVRQTSAAVLAGEGYPYAEVLKRIIHDFARTARADGQLPVVMLIQSRDPADANVLELVRADLSAENVPYLATAEHFDPEIRSGFIGDGHYRPEINHMFAQEFLALLAQFRAISSDRPPPGSGARRNSTN